jgi:ABC1 atypical kinase-like domain
MFNADPHPGNFLFHDDGSVSFLDFGSVRRYEPEEVQMMDVLFRECLRGDVLGTWRASVEAGLWQASGPVTPEDVFAYWCEGNAMLLSEQRFVVTPEYVARGIQRRFSPNGPSGKAVQHSTMPAELTFIARLEIGVVSSVRRSRCHPRIRAPSAWRPSPPTWAGHPARSS